jgi:hypothetical protein
MAGKPTISNQIYADVNGNVGIGGNPNSTDMLKVFGSMLTTGALAIAGALTGVTSAVFNGALSGITTLAMNGALSGVTSIAMAGALTGLTDCTQSGKQIYTQSALTLTNGANTDIATPSATILRVAGPTGAFAVNGFTGGVDGRVLIVVNLVAQNLTFTHQATSAAANQITTLTGSDVATTAAGAGLLVYDGTTSKWVLAFVTA